MQSACKLDQDANAKAAAKDISRKSEESASEDDTIKKAYRGREKNCKGRKTTIERDEQTDQTMHQKQEKIKKARTDTADS